MRNSKLYKPSGLFIIYLKTCVFKKYFANPNRLADKFKYGTNEN